MTPDQKSQGTQSRTQMVSRLIGFGRLNLAVAVVVLLALLALPSVIERFGARVADAPLRALATGEMAAFEFTDEQRSPPNVVFQTASGAETSFLAFRGQVVLINLWATWCTPCVAEMPSLDVLQATLGGKDFEVVAVALDREGAEVAKPFLDGIEVSRLALYTESNLLMPAAFGEPGLPVSILVDARGIEVGRLRGAANWASPEAQALIRYVMGERGQK